MWVGVYIRAKFRKQKGHVQIFYEAMGESVDGTGSVIWGQWGESGEKDVSDGEFLSAQGSVQNVIENPDRTQRQAST